jgi:hypothetical protein
MRAGGEAAFGIVTDRQFKGVVDAKVRQQTGPPQYECLSG